MYKRQLNPKVKVYGVQAENAPSMKRSLEAGEAITLDSVRTFADGIAVKHPGDITLDMVRKYVDEVVTVSEDEIAAAILALMEKQKLSLEETEEMNRRMNQKMQQLDDTISDVSRLVSQLTDLPALALTSQTAVTIRRFDLIYVDANTFIIVVMLSSNSVKNRLVHLPISVDQSMVQKLATLFNASFTGITADQITPLLISSTERAADDTMGLASVIAAFAIEVLTEANTPSAYISGENRLLSQPEFRDPDKAHRLMSYLSGGGYILPPSESMGGTDEVRVLIGPENVAEELKDSSVVIASYDAGDNTRGLIGVVGPTRMDYSAVAAKLSFLAAGLSKRLGGGEAPPEGLHNKLIIKGDDPNGR